METTSLSSRGQIVLPRKIREQLNMQEGDKFAVIGEEDTIILKKISFNGFDELLRKTRDFSKENKIKESDIKSAIRKVRSK